MASWVNTILDQRELCNSIVNDDFKNTLNTIFQIKDVGTSKTVEVRHKYLSNRWNISID